MAISNETWGGMVAMGMRCTVYCDRCPRRVEIDMTRLPPDGKAIGRTFRCSVCGDVGKPIISHSGAPTPGGAHTSR